MKNLFKIIMLVSMGLFLNSCYYDAFPETEEIPPDVVISYENDVMPLWVQCVGCHNGNTPPDLRDEVSYDSLLDGYVEPFDAEESILYKSLLGIDGVSLMPPGSQWPDSKIDIVKTWIDQGAEDN
jgi:hypothetical protein